MMLNTIHFIRPWWLLMLLPWLGLLYYGYKHNYIAKSHWSEYCDAHLLPHVLSQQHNSKPDWWYGIIISLSSFLLIIGLAGPSWSKYAANLYQKQQARIIVLDVSNNMDVTDLQPSRLDRAKYKVLDLLRAIKEGQTGMVVFTSSAFVVSPLTNDSNTIASMVPILDSNIVPVQGSNILTGLKKAVQLFNQAGVNSGEIILVTASSPDPEALKYIPELTRQGFSLSILAIAHKDNIMNPINEQGLQQLSQLGNGIYINFANDNSDVTQLLAQNTSNNPHKLNTQQMTADDLWQDQGYYFIWLAIILASLLARKGWIEKLC
ncbi:MAG: hypothetical protein RLZZ293_300 [Pseudomonadota bacterium]|jgi:Ca-activated chloride channel family protein